ncbi:Uu.00g082490.m01.CDS01 [Anthostomella pinea]|uniref:RBR-type E3 ubiquitin transferase n=1 Tax=Anthostomella pinea TaxID=933095 RepID=A0AAI8VLG7_9PEZI|nr:Uu.00g082490.m01.CDS01 [Anthostomella pinea]
MATAMHAFAPNLPAPEDENFDLILGLLLEDVRQINATSKGKQVEGSVSDGDLALQLYAEELSNASAFAAHRRLTRSIQEAVQTDAGVIARFNREEHMAKHDRDVSIALAEGLQVPPPLTNEPLGILAADIERLSNLYVNRIDLNRHVEEYESSDVGFLGYGRQGEQAESSSWAASRRPTKGTRQQQRRECTSCMEPTNISQLIRAPCQHEYCHDCLLTLFRSAMTDETLFPPQCCRQAIPVDQHRQILGLGLVNRFYEKEIEYSTADGTYCHAVNCAAFIPPAYCEDDVALCVDCGSSTRVHCKRRDHSGDCPFDRELQRVLEMAQQEGWRRCFRCSSVVELNHGCFHITCRCRAEFCYVCGVPWKQCRCPQWDEGRLLDRAVQIDRRNNARNDVAPVRVPAHVPALPRLPIPARPGLGANAQAPFPAAPPRNLPVAAQAQVPFVQAAVPGNIIVLDDSSDDEDVLEPPPERTQDRINIIMNNLRDNHECDHHEGWNRVEGRFACEGCHGRLPNYIFECPRCNIRACRRCRFNRAL